MPGPFSTSPSLAELQARIEDLGAGISHVLAREKSLRNEFGAIAKALAEEFERQPSVARALDHAFRLQEKEMGRLFYGTIDWTVEAECEQLWGRSGRECLAIFPCMAPHSLPPNAVFPSNSIALLTDFKTFHFRRTNEQGHLSEPFRTLDLGAVCNEAVFAGSLWGSIFPACYATLTRTVSCSFSAEIGSQLFEVEESRDAIAVEQAARRALDCFGGPATKLISLEEARQSLEKATEQRLLQSEKVHGAYVVRRYSAPRSLVFDYGTPVEKPSRSDGITTYQIGEHEFHREFVVWPLYESDEDSHLRLAAFNLLHMLAIRRTKLFRTGFASRVYNVLLPPTIFAGKTSEELLAVFPCANLYRTVSGGFRRTVSITFIVAPLRRTSKVNEKATFAARQLTLRELHVLKRDLLAAVPEDDPEANPDQPIPPRYYRYALGLGLPSLLKGIFFEFCDRCLSGGLNSSVERDYLIRTTVFNSLHEAKIVTLALVTDWRPPHGFHHPWERWLAGNEDPVFRSMIFRTLFHDDFLDPFTADASAHAVRLESLNVGNTLGIDMAGMTLFNPQEGVKLVLYPASNERFPNHSVIRWVTWQVYIDSALTALRAMLYNFQPAVDNRAGLVSVIGLLDDMLEEFVELYDLDIRDYSYRKEYQKLRELTGADTDYAQLAAKFAASKEVESLREQRLINKLVVAFTIATVTITIISTLAQIGKMSATTYVVASIALSTVFVWLGFLLFDPLRAGHTRISAAISKAWTSFYEKN